MFQIISLISRVKPRPVDYHVVALSSSSVGRSWKINSIFMLVHRIATKYHTNGGSDSALFLNKTDDVQISMWENGKNNNNDDGQLPRNRHVVGSSTLCVLFIVVSYMLTEE